MAIIECLRNKCPEITGTVFDTPMVQNLSRTKIGRVALYALSALSFVGGAALTAIGVVTISAACAYFPVVNLAFLVGVVASSALMLASMLDAGEKMRSTLFRLGLDVGFAVVSPALPGIALMMSGLDAFRRISQLPSGAPAW
jgi:hypothetical protein